MTTHLFNLFLIASYLFATGTAALHTHDHGHGHGGDSEEVVASEGHAHSHAGCSHHHEESSNNSQHDGHSHAPAFEHECGLCSFAALNASILTAPPIQTGGELINRLAPLDIAAPSIAVRYSWQQRGPPVV
jgi:hypothetical protein